MARNGIESTPKIASSFEYAEIRISPICAWLALHRALDLGRLEQRRVGVHGDLELAAGRLVDVGDELHDVLGVEVGRRIGGRHVPLGLRAGRQRERATRADRGEQIPGSAS